VSLLIRTTTAEISSIEVESGPIVTVRILPDVLQTLDDARSNIEASVSAATNRRSRLLVDIRKAAIITAEVRHYYSGEILTQWFSAIGLLVDASPLGRVMGNLYMRIAQPGLPTRIFTDEEAAMSWLRKAVI